MIETVYREGDRIRASNGEGYGDGVEDGAIRGHMPHVGPDAYALDAFCRAVLAIREYERARAAIRAGRRS